MIELIIKLLSIFLVFSFLGWLFEYIIFNKDSYEKTLKKYYNINLPILPIYGAGGIILWFIYKFYDDDGILLKLLSILIFINIFECGSGLLSYRINGYQTWRYTDEMVPFCHGYVSLYTALFWLLAGFVVIEFYREVGL